MTPQMKAMAAEYVRAISVAVLTLVAAGHFEPRSMAIAAAAALLPLLTRGVNPNDTDFGRGADETDA
jgi:hypothetical protein